MTSPIMPNTPAPPPPVAAAAPAGLNAAQQMALKNLGSLNGLPPGFAPPTPGRAPMMARGPGRAAVGMGPNRAKGGPIKAKKYAKGGSVSSASSRADGCASKGKTKGKMV